MPLTVTKREYDPEYWRAKDDPANKALADMIADKVTANGQQMSLWYFVVIAIVFLLGLIAGATLARR